MHAPPLELELFNRDATADSGYWDHPINRVSPDDVDLRLIRWFDFDGLAFCDFKYYQVHIRSSHLEGVSGRVALVECEYARVLLDEAALESGGQPP